MIIAASFDTKNSELWVNRGLTYGDGLFETMRFNQQRIPLLTWHMDRLNNSLEKLHLKRFNHQVIEHSVVKLQQAAMVKLIVFRGQQIRTYTPLTQEIDWLLTAEKLPEMIRHETLKLAFCGQPISRQPMLAGMKHISRIEQVMLAAQLANQTDVDDLVVCDNKQRIIETTYQNIVMIKNNRLFTPKLDNSGVKGVALQWLKANYAVEVKHIYTADICDYDGMLVGNSIRGFRRVENIQLNKKQCISFGTSHDIQDKITSQWDALFNS